MILNNTPIKIDSNVAPTKALNFGISDVRLVVDILSKLYAYPIRTLVQEYICNGRDAMREAGTWGKLPIEITIPNTLDPVFKVRDFGVGISPDRMENIFVNYGSSTKRNTNTQTGGFGIGAKSAFSYTDSFTVTSFYDGVRYLYVAHLGDEGGVNLISKNNTSQPNGVEISIGVKPKDISEFRNAVQRCVRFWQEPIKFSGSKDIHQLEPEISLGDMTVYQCSSSESRTIYLIDGIEYDLMSESTNYWKDRSNELHSGDHIVAINIPNGQFKIASSRERLETNDQNKSKQDQILDTCKTLITQTINTKINKTSIDLPTRIENKKYFSGFQLIKETELDLGNGYKLGKKAIHCPSSLGYRYVRRGRRGSIHFEFSNTSHPSLDSVIYTSSDYTSNTLARKLNHYLESNRDVVLISEQAISVIPHNELIFTNRINADTLPVPPKKTAQRVHKSTRDAICWSINTAGQKSQWTVEKLNTHHSVVVFVDEITPEAREIAGFLTVIIVPKCNKDLVNKSGMTIEEANNFLLSRHKEEVIGVDKLPHDWKKIDVLKKFKPTKASDELQQYLFDKFPKLKEQNTKMNEEFNGLVKKYPLVTVLYSLAHYSSNSSKIVIDEINKQTKES
jgi:homoserine trans-succinylase